ncbi:glycoside hydrolase family 3 N-terminal domain-containing protein [Streptobacillus felis]|uniref:beta-N-acetylhexosaminidase n=1 Tax=Streptobacillus felis TaxID=1384509 RepID=A0A7Z0PEZ6_9FUSO|nr:glycoside hydrolase family 3 N-terminal domain-containing protein [Streptobacillus felis]NYV28001.1 beta-hexosaminidase [Streptobacillus felis]
MKKMLRFLFFFFMPFMVFANDMEIRNKIEYLIMPDFRYWNVDENGKKKDFDVMNDEVRDVIKTHNFNGVILFAQNVKQTEQTLRLVDEIQKASKTPMFISIDQEGGIVTRLGTGTNFPGNMAIGATRNEKYSYEVGKAIGRELHALGINTNLAPTIDVNNNAKNPVIGLRSFSSDPNIVASLSRSMINGIKQENVIAVAKHFPGHGDTAIDTHLGLASVDKSMEELEAIELLPFKKAIEADIDMIMTAHVQLPQIEKDYFVAKNGDKIIYPSTISDDVITGILREKLGYDGVVITDALGMKAISDNLGPVEAMKLSINAGVDILLMPISLHSMKDVKELDKAIDKLVEAVKNGEISMQKIDKSISRINALKEKRHVVKDETNIDVRIENALKVIGSKQNRDLEREVSKNAITVVKDTPLKEMKRVLILGTDTSQRKVTEFAITRLFDEGKLQDLSYKFMIYGKDTKEIDIISQSTDVDTIIVYGAMNNENALNPESYRTKVPNMVAKLEGLQKIYVSINKPYDVTAHLDYDKVLIAYGFKGMDPTEVDGGIKAFGPNIPAALEIIFTQEEAKGKLPVDLPFIENGKLTEKVQFNLVK